MAVLSREELLAQISAKCSAENSDEDIALLENVTDTLADLETRANGDGKDWKAEAERIDKEWREKYVARFNSNSADDDDLDKPRKDERKNYSFDNLFQ